MSRLWFAIIFLISLATVARAGDEQPNKGQPPIVLAAGSSKVLSLPGFSAETGPQCDPRGNLYFRTGYSELASVVLRIAAKDGSPTVYKVTDPAADGSYFVAFHVGREGKIAVLMGGKKDEPSVYQFKENDPAGTNRTALEAPEGLDALTVHAFVVLPNDHILLQGYFGKGAPKDKLGHAYLAEFESSGKLLRLSLNNVSDELLKSVENWGAKTETAQGEDGRTYLLLEDRVVVLSPGGEVERELKLTPPESGYRPDLMYMHGGQLIIGFYLLGGAGKPIQGVRFELLEPSSGEILRTFEGAPELGNNLVCFSDEGLTFMRFEHGKVKLINAPVK